MSRAFLSRGGARFAIQMKVSAGLALAGAMHTKLWLRAYALSNDLESTMNAPTLPSLAMPSLHNPRLRVATAHLIQPAETSAAFELVLRPSEHASTEEPDLAQPSGCEEVWEHVVLRNHDSAPDTALSSDASNGASSDPLSWRGVALSLRAPPQVQALLEAIDEARDDGPSYVAFATVVERTRALSPRAKELAYAGHGPDSAFVIGWPSLDQLRSAFDAHNSSGSSSGGTSSGSVFSDALLAKLDLDYSLWGELQDLLDASNADAGSTTDGEAAAAPAPPPRLRISWHRPYLDKTTRKRLHDVHIHLEPAPMPAAASSSSEASSSAHSGWLAARSEAWRTHLEEIDLLEESEGMAEKMLKIATGGGSEELVKRRRRLGGGRGPEKSASELATASPGSTQQGDVRLWFPVRDGAVAHVHDEAAALEASLEALDFGDIAVVSSMKGGDNSSSIGVTHGRRLDAETDPYWRTLCATDSSGWTDVKPDGCDGNWRQASNSDFCVSPYNPDCHVCGKGGTESGYYQVGQYRAYCECPGGQYSGAGSLACSICPAGQYSEDVAASCINCPTGHYSGSSASSCVECSGGYEALSTGSTSCDECAAGQYSSGGASTVPECTSCPAGKYQDATTQSSCISCVAGFYCGSTGMTTYIGSGCPAGTFSSAGATACTNCPAGYFTASAESASCGACGAGTYSNLGSGVSGSTYCEDCSAGQYQAAAAQSSCEDCPVASYSSSDGSVACSDCSAGRYQSATGRVSCSKCSTGTYSAAGASACTSCAAGKYASISGLSTCTSCATGKYQSFTGASSCVSCAAGKYTDTAGSTTCTTCSIGQYAATSSSSLCTSCLTGQYQDTTGAMVCKDCTGGQYTAVAGSSSCSTCASGRYSDDVATSCPPCSAGQYSSAGASACTSCAAGTYSSSSGLGACSNCQAGTYSLSGASGCTDCAAGQYSASSRASTCTSCNAGQYQSLPQQSACLDCNSGSYASSSGASTCIDCSAGQYSGGGASACVACAAGYVAVQAGLTTCSPCSAGYYSGSGASVCTACAAGYYSSASPSTSCTACPKGKYSASAATSCTACGAGRYGAISASTSCSLCSTGKYSSGDTASCIACAVGQYASLEGSVTCTNCTAGTFASAVQRSDCTDCPGGKYNDRGGLSLCFDCEQGFYQDVEGSMSCKQCANGTTSSAGASICNDGCDAGTYLVGFACIDCPAGQYSLAGASGGCTPCSAGYFAATTATASACTVSPAGSYVASSGASTAVACPSGTYSATAATVCSNCPAGYFSSSGSATCDGSCPAGTYAGSGSSECVSCDAGYYSNPNAESCILCDPGKYTASTGSASCSLCADGYSTSPDGTAAGTNEFVYGSTACVICPSGRYDRNTRDFCAISPAGTYCPGQGNSFYTDCPAGHYQDATGQVACKSCAAGQYSSAVAQSSCSPCAAGTYAANTLSTTCTSCPAGTYSFAGASSCTACPAGTYSLAGALLCEFCNNGTYSGTSRSGGCTDCVPGRYTGTVGAFKSCSLCAKGFAVNKTAATSCDECAPGRFASSTGTDVCELCDAGYLCAAGSIRADESDCVNATEPNPEAFYCPRGSFKRARAPDNWFTTPESLDYTRNRQAAEPCPRTSQCVNGLQTSSLFWDTGECATGVDKNGRGVATRAAVSVDEATDGLLVGTKQTVLSPYPVKFELSGYGRRYFALDVSGNGTQAQVLVNASNTDGLDYETTDKYSLGLTAYSNGSVINCTLVVSVIDVNEAPTIVLGDPPVRNISEAALVNDYVNGAPCKAEDEDTANEHIYSIVSAYPKDGMGYFGIGGCSGKVYLLSTGLSVLLQPQYTLTIRVIDDAASPLSDFGNLTVDVLNANDAPYFLVTSSEVHCNIDENVAGNTTVNGTNCTGGVKWTDPDLPFGDYVVWSISRDDVDDTFQIDADTGVLSLKRSNTLDYEDQKTYSIAITITDTGGLSASLDLSIQVNDVNEPPSTEYPLVFVNENTAPGTVLVASSRVITTDVDSGPRFSYKLVMDGNSTDVNATLRFNISNNDGTLTVGPAGLNYEKQSSYLVTVETHDFGLDDCAASCPGTYLSSITRVAVEVRDVNEAPSLRLDRDVYWMAESAELGTNLGFVYVKDPDFGQSHSYNTAGADGDAFSVSAFGVKTGLVKLNSEGVLDYERSPGPLQVRVTVSDGSLQSTKNLTVMVNNSNDAPVCPPNLALAVEENTVGELVPYRNGMPGVSGTLGDGLRVAAFNYSDQDDPSTTLGAAVWGEGSLEVASVSAGAVVSAQCFDAKCENRQANLTLHGALNYETTPEMTFVVKVTDGGGLSCSTYATVHVVDVNEQPYFTGDQANQTMFVSDNYLQGDSVGVVTATDPDDSDSSFGTLSYGLVYTRDGSPLVCTADGYTVDTVSGGTLAIDSSTGELTLLNTAGTSTAGSAFCVGVKATDGGNLTTTTVVNVYVTQSNVAPSFTTVRVYVPEDQASYTNLTSLVGTDPDPGSDGLKFKVQACSAGPNGTLTCNGRESMFTIVNWDGQRGASTTALMQLGASQLNYEDTVFDGQTPAYILTLKLTDSESPVSLSAFGTLEVYVTDVPESPTFADSSFDVDEAQDYGATVGDVSSFAEDQDFGSSITFSMDDHFTFASSAMTWEQCWTSCANSGLQMACVDSAEEQDRLLGQYNGSAAYVWMGYRDVGADGSFVWDEVPGCDPRGDGYTNWASDQPATSTTLNCALVATSSPHEWTTARCSATPAVGAASCACEPGPFNISSAGVITTTGVLDYETLDSYELPLVATDNTGLATAATASIAVQDVDEAPVVPSGQKYSVVEGVSRGTTIGSVEASDNDVGDIVTFALLNGTDLFTLSADDGDLILGGTDSSATLDFECQTKYVLSIRASDQSGLETFEFITVDVLDANDATITSINTVRNISMPMGDANGYFYDTSSSYNCVCENYGYTYVDGAVVFGTADLCYRNLATESDSDCGNTLSYLCSGSVSDVTTSVIASIECSAPDLLPTLGGHDWSDPSSNGLVQLKGTNFGPCGGGGSDVVVTASYTNNLDGLTYEATDCSLYGDSNTEVRCVAAPGVGTSHIWNVTIDSSAASYSGGGTPGGPWPVYSTDTTSYAPPSIVNISGANNMNTAGGDVITLTGTNFPPNECTSLTACGGDAHAVALAAAAAEISIKYDGSGVASRGGNVDSSAIFICTNVVVIAGGTRITCEVPSGVGASLYWAIEVGAAEVAATAQTSGFVQFADTNYAAPQIYALAPNYAVDYAALGLRGIFDLRTAGGDFVLIQGKNLGPNFATLYSSSTASQNSAPALEVTYGPVNGGYWDYNQDDSDGGIFKYTAADCYVFTASTEVLCTTVSGVGANLTWRVMVGGQAGTSSCVPENPYEMGDDSTGGGAKNCTYNLTTSYAPPHVKPTSELADSSSSNAKAVTGAGVSDATTVGGQQLVVSGSEFGPSANEEIPVVTYGPIGEVDRYHATDCEVSVDYSQVSCLTAEGVGKGHVLAVTVGGQTSNIYPANISYSTPNVANYLASWDLAEASSSGTGASTKGGQWVVLQGRNFGTVAESRITEVKYSAPDSGAGFVETFYTCQSDENLYAGKAVPTITHPTKGGYYFHASTTPACVCGAYGYDYNGGAVTYDTTDVCSINMGCNYLEEFVGCGKIQMFVASIDCQQPDTTLSPYYDCGSSNATSCLLLSGAIDGPLSGGTPKAIELYAACDIFDLSAYGLGLANNGGGSDGQEYTFPSDAVAANTFIYVSYPSDTTNFEAFFGFAPTYAGTSAANFNGDDAIELYLDGSVVDVLGEPTYTASTPDWAFTDGWIYRINGTAPDGTTGYASNHWVIEYNVLDGYATNDAATVNSVGFPLKSYVNDGGWDPLAGCVVVSPCSCAVSTDHTAINCSTVAGAGAGHTWVVTIDGQASTAATTAYGKPVITGLSGVGAVNASTYGGEAVTLTGYNFGPKKGAGAEGNTSFLDAVTYGPGGSEYSADKCRVSVGHTEIVCFTVAGVGSSLVWVVTVDGQSSEASESPVSNYASPMLAGLSPQRVGTSGGSKHVLNGTNLGMASTDSFLNVYLDGKLLAVDNGKLTTIYPASSELMFKEANPSYTDGTDGVTAPWIEGLLVEMPSLSDESHTKVLTVSVGRRTGGSSAAAVSNPTTAIYKPPVLTEVQNIEGVRVGTKATSDLVLLGRNFGSTGTVWYNGVSVDGSDGAAGITAWKDNEISLQVVGLNGNVSVTVGIYETRTLFFDDFSPVLMTSYAKYLPDTSGYRTDARGTYSGAADDDVTTNEGEGAHRNLTLAGLYFGTVVSDLSVTIGSGKYIADCPIWPQSLVEVPEIVSTDTIRAVTCQVPPGAGLDNPVIFARSAKTSFLANATETVTLNYNAPVITQVSPYKVHTTGGDITIAGYNFGSVSARASLLYGDTKLKLSAASYDHTMLVATVPPGDGSGRLLRLSVDEQDVTVWPSDAAAVANGVNPSTASIVVGFKYYGPNVSAVVMIDGSSGEDDRDGGSTTGFTVLVEGSDLGLPGSLNARMVRKVGSVTDDDSDDSARRRRLSQYDTAAAAEVRLSDGFVNYDGLVNEPVLYHHRALQANDDDGWTESEWEELPFIEVEVLRSNHSEALIEVGPGEGDNYLLVNVSGQVTLAHVPYAHPNLTSVEPASLPTIGGVNVTVLGVNFGVGNSFTLRLEGAGDAQGYCDFAWDESDLHFSAGGSNPTGSILEFEQGLIRFIAPAGQCDAPMNLTLTVAGQASWQSLSVSFAPPTITMLSKDGAIPLGSDCDRSSEAGCGLLTSGGYTLTMTGENFGLSDRQVWFDGEALPTADYQFSGHTQVSFEVPAGAGAHVPVMVSVGGRESEPIVFAYDPPYVTSFTPNEFDADEDVIEIYGRNFGSSLADAGAVSIEIGNSTCGPVVIGSQVAEIWQKSRAGVPYLWCSVSHTTVGLKSLIIHVAGQNVTKDEENSGVRGVCSSGFYGQQAWTVFTGEDSECELPCDKAQTSAHSSLEGGRSCTAHYDASANDYVLLDEFDDENPACEDEWACMIRADLATGATSNCTILTRQDEYCAECPTGSECEDFSTLYSVEPIATPGYWRSALKTGDENSDGIFTCPPNREHRAYCWDFSPCLPGNACEGDNQCAKGYTDEKCAQCCDWNFAKLEDGSPNPDCYHDETGEQLLYHRVYGKCEECPNNILWILLGAFIGVLFACLLARRLQRKKVDLAIFSIGIDYFQVLAIFAGTEVEWPASVQMLFRYMSLFNFSINLTPPECLLEVPYRTKWLAIEWFPSVLFGLVGLLFVSTLVYFRYCSSHNTRRVRNARNSVVAGSLLLMYILYLNISENTLDPLNCNYVEAEDGTTTKLQYMTSQPSEVCWQKGKYTLQQELVPYAWLFFVLYTIGYPLLVAAILLKPENREKCINDQYLRCLGTGSKKETNKAYFNFRSKYATLYFKFKPKNYYWILLIVLRKLCIVSFTVLFHVNATMQLSMILLVVFLSYTMQVKHNPYLSRADYEDIVGEMDEDAYNNLVGPYGACPQPKGIGYESLISEKAQVAMARISLVGAMEKSGGITREELKKSGERVLKFAFNYNTVESFLLFCAILVCLFGIMFASEFSGPGEVLYERLGELTLAVIGVSLVYYFSVLWVEVVAVMFPSLAFSFLSGAVDQKRDQTLDADGNLVVVDSDGEAEDDEKNAFNAITAGMAEDDRDAYKIRTIDRDVVYQPTNPLIVRKMEADAASFALNPSGEDSGQDEVALLSLEDQVALQTTVTSLMDEIKSLKKKVASAGQSAAASSAVAGPLKKAKNKIGGSRGDEGKMRGAHGGYAPHDEDHDDYHPPKEAPKHHNHRGRDKSPVKQNTSGADDDDMDMGEMFGTTARQGSVTLRLGSASSADTIMMGSNPMSRGKAPNQGGIMNPLGVNGGSAKKGGSKKAAKMANSAFNDEDIL